jgi:sugar transferase (PEP-CTERM/EpsH1 system associated)
MMEDLLFLTPRIPYPPNKGDKLRSWNILKHLSQRYRIHLGCFVDDEDDWQHVPFLQDLCATTHFAKLDLPRKLVRAGKGLLMGKPMSTAFFMDQGFADWVSETIQDIQPAKAFFFSSEMAEYLPVVKASGARLVVDIVDMDSAKWREYGEVRSWPKSWLFRREGKLVYDLEVKMAQQADQTVFVSAEEAALFNGTLQSGTPKASVLPNGVDSEYFSPDGAHPSPYQPGQKVIVFTGLMDYWPNIDGVRWFADSVFPTIQAAIPETCFYIVGMRPTTEVEKLGNRAGITVTGGVPDVRPYVANAAFAVAPLLVARGVQNKVIEAMAMGKPVLATPAAAEGLGEMTAQELGIDDDADALAAHAIDMLRDETTAPNGIAARAKIEADFSWEGQLSRLDDMLSGQRVD